MMALFAVFACERVEELSQPENGQETVVEKVKMTFSAEIESDDTKTVLVDSDVENVKKVFWQAGDAIAVAAEHPAPAGGYWDEWSGQWVSGTFISSDKFTAKTSSPVSKTEFDGSTEFGAKFLAFYPYSETVTDTSNVFYFDMPAVQKYVNGSFDPNAAPMVATAGYGETFKFKNAYGVLALNLKGSDLVESISFSAYNEFGAAVALTGRFKVNPNEEEPVMTSYKNLGYSVKLECEQPVQLGEAATPFYIILPPGTYSSFSLTITTHLGNKMLKSGTNPLTIQRSHIKPTGDLEYIETQEIDLSECGNANCYIVPQAGLYCFDADVVGNGEYGYVMNESFYPTSPEINPSKVELLWEEYTGMVVLDSEIVDGKVHFQTNGKEGNAVVAVKDESENILWSWHLWMTDEPQEQIYENSKGTFTVLDRNIGATRADRGTGEEWKDSRGTLYQWGRKDPFRQEITPQQLNSQAYLEEIILYPTIFFSGSSNWVKEEDRSDYFWSTHQKTIYDPCPVGYRVPVQNIWAGFTNNGENADRVFKINAQSSFDYGFNFYYDENQNTAWYPVVSILSDGGYINWSTIDARYWSANNYDWEWAYRLYFSYSSDMECVVQIKDSYENKSRAFSVRCMKDDGHVDLSKPTVKITVKDRTSSSATVVVTVTDEGAEPVSEVGVFFGTTPDLATATYYSLGEVKGEGEYSYTFTGLESATRYYVTAFAENNRGETYSDVSTFKTTWEGEVDDLSREGTANSYIVPPYYGEYSFNATVKGNSTESVGKIHTACVVWESHMDLVNVPLKEGDIIEKVEIKGDKVHFMLPQDPTPGNAVIAVKDVNGTILWSWHIWVVDFDPETTSHKMKSGAVMMDRNLGALNVVPGDFKNLGLYYQWGRKDPFVGMYSDGRENPVKTAPSDVIYMVSPDDNTNRLEYCVMNPNVIVDNTSWNSDNSLWAEKKTMYDPCPAGWRVPSSSVWEGEAIDHSYETYHYVVLTDSKALYPSAGNLDWWSMNDLYNVGYYWTLNQQYTRTHRGWTYFYMYESSWGRDVPMSIRCMKENPKQSGDNEGYKENEDYEW